MTNEAAIADLIAHLNPKQQEAVQTVLGPVLIVAGPGSGKTRVLTHRIAALIKSGVEPWRILAVTFTNKASKEMQSRVETLIGDQSNEVWVSTFHKTCARILRNHYAEANLPRGFAIASYDDSKAIMKKVLTDRGVEPDNQTLNNSLSSVSSAKNKMITPDMMASSPSLKQQKFAPFYKLYNEKLLAAKLVDFDDLLLKTLELLRDNPEIAERYQKRFNYIMVDEFQDTNAPQYEIIKILAKLHKNLCVVGDMDQLLYSWRNASTEIMNTFTQDWKNTKVITLDQNYRSTKTILDVAKAIIEPNDAQHRASLWTQNPQGDPVHLYEFSDADEEADWVKTTIKQGQQAGTSLNDFAILYRTNAQSRLIETALRNAGIKARLIGAQRFYDRAEVRDVIAYLKLVINPDDEISLARAAGVPRRGLGPTALSSAIVASTLENKDPISWAREQLEADNLGRAKGAWTKFLRDFDKVLEAAFISPSEAVRAVRNLPGFDDAILSKGGEEPQERLNNVDELISDAEEFMLNPPADISSLEEDLAQHHDDPRLAALVAFLEHISLVADVEEDEVAEAVWLMTCHAAKGKEFPTVFVIGLEDGLFPHERSKGDLLAEAEERRIAFVAVSRAEKILYLSYAHRRRAGGDYKEQLPSPYLRDLPSSVIKHTQVDQLYSRRSSSFPSSPRPYSPTQSFFKKPAKDISAYKINQMVRHTSFGLGVILSINKTVANIKFQDKVRTLDLTLAPLEIED